MWNQRCALFFALLAAVAALGTSAACVVAPASSCDNKNPGDTCTQCNGDPNCVETQIVKVCSPRGVCQSSYECPPDQTINCMPIVPPERRNYCSGNYGKWIAANCKGVSFTY